MKCDPFDLNLYQSYVWISYEFSSDYSELFYKNSKGKKIASPLYVYCSAVRSGLCDRIFYRRKDMSPLPPSYIPIVLPTIHCHPIIYDNTLSQLL